MAFTLEFEECISESLERWSASKLHCELLTFHNRHRWNIRFGISFKHPLYFFFKSLCMQLTKRVCYSLRKTMFLIYISSHNPLLWLLHWNSQRFNNFSGMSTIVADGWLKDAPTTTDFPTHILPAGLGILINSLQFTRTPSPSWCLMKSIRSKQWYLVFIDQCLMGLMLLG